MKVTIFGTGGIGGYIAGKLGAVVGDQRSGLGTISLIARGKHLEKIRAQGLEFIDLEGNSRRIRPNRATDAFSKLEPQDVVFLCVKGYDLQATMEEIAPYIGEETLVIPLLNGADMYERVRGRIDAGIVLPGAIYISSAVVEPGTVQHKGGGGLVILGKGPGRDAVKPQPLLEAFDAAEIPYQWHEDPFPAIWSKYLFISPFSLAGAVTGKTLGEVIEDEKTAADVRNMMKEVEAVARAKGVGLAEDAVDSTFEKAKGFPPETKTSFQRDIEAGKERDERDVFGGTVVRLGKELGVETPTVDRYYGALP